MPLPKRVLEKAKGQKTTKQSNEPMTRWETHCDLRRTGVVLGIDPGLLGGFAFFDCWNQKFGSVLSTPIVKGANGKNTYDITKLFRTVTTIIHRDFDNRTFTFCIEQQQPMAHQGLVSTFTTGYGFGMWMGILHSIPIPAYNPEPQICVVSAKDWQHILWKEHADKDETKAKSIARVHRLFPDVDLTAGGRSKRDLDGKADACNIAHYAFMRMVQDNDIDG